MTVKVKETMVTTCICDFCNYEWTPKQQKGQLPKECPSCKKRNWNFKTEQERGE